MEVDRMKYHVWCRLEVEEWDVEADSEEDAFIQVSDGAMAGGSWDYIVKPMEGDETDD